MLALTGRLSLQGHSKRSPHLVYEPDQRVWIPWHYHLSIWIKVQKRECDSDCGKALQKHPFISIFNERTNHHNWESWDLMKAFKNYFIDISNNPLKTFPGELKSIHKCKQSPFLRRVPITGRSSFTWKKDACEMELHWPASPEAPSPPRLRVSCLGVLHTTFDLARHNEGASLSTLHSLHPHRASLWSKDCVMFDYNQLPLSTSNLGFTARRWNQMQAAPLGANILLGDQPLAQLCQVHFWQATARVHISKWAVPWKCPPISRYLSQQSEEMGSFGRSRGPGYHSISDSFCPKSKPLLGE